MPDYEIRITEAAGADLVDIIEYIAHDNPTAAIKLADEIDHRVSYLKDFPGMGTNPKNRRLVNKGYKMLIINDYLVFYVLTGNTVEIRRIISGERNYVTLL